MLVYGKDQEHLKGQKKVGTYYTEPNFLYNDHFPLLMRKIILRCIGNKRFHATAKEN